MIYRLIRPALFCLDAEKAHGLALAALKRSRTPAAIRTGGALETRVAGLTFPNPVGMAAGFDKDGEVPDALLGLGFGFAEVGSITPLPQDGNPRPRLFRLKEDRAVINRMGFNNGGALSAIRRFEARRGTPGIVGINIGANKDSEDRIADYARMAVAMAPFASYLAVNISSPNTPGLRALQDEAALTDLLDAVLASRGENGPPVFLKVAPDLEPADIDAIARIAIEKKLDALIVSNTTISRPPLKSRFAGEAGGLSGAPLREKSLGVLKILRRETRGKIPLIGVGGIANADDAYARIRAGASAVQLYTAMIYQGPSLGARIAEGLADRLKSDGFQSVAEAVGN